MRALTVLICAQTLCVAKPLLATEPQDATMGMEYLPVLAETRHFRHDSNLLGRPLHIHVRLPDELPANKKVPVIYLLDGDEAFPLMASYTWYLTFEEVLEPSILVGISYGSIDPAVNMRITDFTGPSAENAQYGGADHFLAMLEQELMPEVERRFPADPTHRTLVGQSLGGQFVLHAALHRPGLFRLSVAVNPALHRNLPYYLAATQKLPQPTGPTWLYVSSGEFDDPRFRGPAVAWMAEAGKPGVLPLCLRTESLKDETHLSSLPRAFRNAVRWQQQAVSSCKPGSEPATRDPDDEIPR